jgi:lysophospholipase L1-like esterase
MFSLATSMTLADTPQLVPPSPRPEALPAGLNVLMIGDSNTEIGHISGGLARMFEEKYGYFGSGYHSLNATIGMGSGYLPYLRITNDAQWEAYTMLWPVAAPKPYLAPEGTGITSSKTGACTRVEFFGTGIDLYWLAQAGGGRCAVTVDDGAAQTIDTRGERAVRRARVEKLPSAWHTLRAVVETGPVMLLGVDARMATAKPSGRAAVNKWGKGWATTQDFVDVDPTVFRDALKFVDPDVTVILLGTNDHNLAGHNRDQYAANLREIVARVKAAVPGTRVLLLSTAQVDSPWSNNGLAEYRKILPELSDQVGATYWDMSSWFGGPWATNNAAGLMQDGVHVSQKGGEKIAGRLYDEILKVAAAQPGMPAARPVANGRVVGKPMPENAVPLQVPGLTAWWSAEGQAVVDESSGVIRWLDASGMKADGIAPWSWSRPQYVEKASGGKPLLHFDGKGSHLLFPMQEGAQTLFVVMRADKLILGHPYFNTRPFSSGAVRPKKAFSVNYAAKAVTEGKGFLNGQLVHLPDDQDAALEFDPGKLQLFSLVMTGPVPFSYLGWGGSWNFDRYLKGDVAELLVYNRALTDGERCRIETDLATRWNILLE